MVSSVDLPSQLPSCLPDPKVSITSYCLFYCVCLFVAAHIATTTILPSSRITGTSTVAQAQKVEVLLAEGGAQQAAWQMVHL
jgi:hypothetical protein